ncbi:hypothetical protein AYK24_07520 [Thermoplasmatales archaeon SG8-52-4]|nr:MAG: hypothetical protein AYK24_07520 [Thermoplasmatales archaeon SG8-52-4]
MNNQNNILSKIQSIGILILFIGVLIAPNICGYENKSNIQYEKEKPVIFPLNDDYINAYWEFNECTGDTVGDSSIPYYNGTIYGATWVGTSPDCALYFDGVDDYVDFTSHSAELGFNKTDDFIISFYFKSTGAGIIYSSTASWGFNPELIIELLSNGSLLFILKGSSNLGITLYSTDTYNDDSWHFVQYYHFGISSTPTVNLYVDGYFDNSATHYYYNQENDEYVKTKMGVHVHTSTDYFEGFIDDFKIVKYELGNKQVPPEIDGIGGQPGEQLEFTFVTNDPEGDDIWILIDWGDGTEEDWRGPYESGEEVIVSHIWDEVGIYHLTAKSMDIWDDSPWSEVFEVRIGYEEPIPKICCSGSINLSNVKPEAQLTGDFEVFNCGEDESTLNWTVSEYPIWGSDWTFTPDSGGNLTPAQGPITVNVEFIAPPDIESNFSGVIKVENIDDPSDFCEIPVFVKTPRNKMFSYNNLIIDWLLECFPQLNILLQFFIN